jgi:DNA-binding MarR family transcriptional regulator
MLGVSSGRLLAARERSAADKRQYALELLEQKEAAVARRRRELQVQDARMLTYSDIC